MSWATKLFAWSAFPIGFCGSIAAALALIDAGWLPRLAFVPPVIAVYTAIALLERVFPYQRSWQASHGDLALDSSLMGSNMLLNQISEPFILAAMVSVGVWLSAAAGFGLWPDAWPILLQLGTALLIAELFEYSCHRAMHEVPLLWRFHATHHSAPRLYWLNTVRFHPVDLMLVGTGKLMPLAILGANETVLALVALVAAVHGVFQHANLRLRLGPLNWIFSMAELHRWHHSPIVEEANHNYGGNLIFWDIVFGTRYLPGDREPPSLVGLGDDQSYPRTLWGHWIWPFQRSH